jgi:hypothetical protein
MANAVQEAPRNRLQILTDVAAVAQGIARRGIKCIRAPFPP